MFHSSLQYRSTLEQPRLCESTAIQINQPVNQSIRQSDRPASIDHPMNFVHDHQDESIDRRQYSYIAIVNRSMYTVVAFLPTD